MSTMDEQIPEGLAEALFAAHGEMTTQAEEPEEPASLRERILADAWAVVTQDRNISYGEPEDSFKTIADLWSVYLGVPLLPQDVSTLMVLLKVARLQTNPGHRDSWVDIAGYAACGGGLTGEAEQ